ncbi:MAG TPA: PmoA family protein [Chitinophagaceae bacterium]|nr:PmoA family protein [Chitinophagaceae bacterium]
MRFWPLLFLFPISVAGQKIMLEPGTTMGPVSVQLKKPGKGDYGLRSKLSGKTYPLQWEDEHTALCIVDEKSLTPIELTVQKINKPKISVSLDSDKNGILIRSGEKKVFYYQSASAMPPPDSPAYYQRSGFIHPLYSPAGKILTDDFPVTHAHQHAIFHAWADTRFRGTHVDFWNQFKKEGTVRHKGVISSKAGPVFSELVSLQEYISVLHGVVLSEKWTMRCYATKGVFILDIKIDQENITEDTLYLDKYIYGGMAFRGAAQWDTQNPKYFQNRWNVTTSEGLKDSLANNSSAKWVTVSGKIDGTNASVTVFSHPLNFRSPQKIRVHPSMPYWAYSPVIDGAFKIAPHGKYSARYRYYVSDEVPEEENLKRIFNLWSKQ